MLYYFEWVLKMNRKGAIELSANFIIVIIISLVVVIGGLSIFFKMQKNLEDSAKIMDQQTEENIKQMMLSNSYHVAVYPNDPIIKNGDAVLVGVGITNILTDPDGKTFNVDVSDVTYYETSTSPPDSKTDKSSYYDISSTKPTIATGEQVVKGVLLRMPKGAAKGQYIYTITIKDTTADPTENYGVVQVYASNK